MDLMCIIILQFDLCGTAAPISYHIKVPCSKGTCKGLIEEHATHLKMQMGHMVPDVIN